MVMKTKYIQQDEFIIQVARLIKTVGASRLNKREHEKARSRIQTLFSDFLETKIGLQKGEKTSSGSKADLRVSDAEATEVFGVTGSVADQIRDIELKSSLTGEKTQTATSKNIATARGRKRRAFIDDQRNITYTGDDLQFSGDDQAKMDDINEFFANNPDQLQGKEIEVQDKFGRRSRTGEFFIPRKPDGTVDFQNISAVSIGMFVKTSKSKFAQQLRDQVDDKMEEAASFNFNYDVLKKKKQAPFTFARKGMLDYATDYNYNLRIRESDPKADGSVTSSFILEVKINASGAAKFDKAVFKLKQAPNEVMKEFIAYSIGVLNSQSRGTDRANREYLKTFIGLFSGFEVGKLTPLVIQGALSVPSKLTVRGSGKYRQRKSTGKTKRRSAQGPRARFISSVQLTALVQDRLAELMPRGGPPERPIPKWRTGALVESFQVRVNYRENLIRYYNTPPVSTYVGQLNSNGWRLDSGLVQLSIRQLTQQLFGRQFRVLRTQ